MTADRWWTEPGGRGRAAGAARTETLGAIVAGIGLVLCLTPLWLVGVPLLFGGVLTLVAERTPTRSSSHPIEDIATEEWSALDDQQARRLLEEE